MWRVIGVHACMSFFQRIYEVQGGRIMTKLIISQRYHKDGVNSHGYG